MKRVISGKKIGWTITLAMFCLVSMAHLSGAHAQDKKGGGGVIRLEVTTIEGRVQKPNAFFINTRRSLVYESMEVKDSFLEEITKVVDSGDF